MINKKGKKIKDTKGYGEDITVYKLNQKELEVYLKNIDSREVTRRKKEEF